MATYEESGTVVGKAKVGADLAVGTELWLIWADIAIEQAEHARAARRLLAEQVEAGAQPDMNIELHPALIAIAGAAASIDGFALEIEKTDAVLQAELPAKPKRANYVWAWLQAGFDASSQANDWPRNLKGLFKLRNGGLHPETIFGETAKHPVLENVSAARTIYTTENADKAVALMRNVFKTCRASVRSEYPELVSRMSGLDGALRKVAP